VGSAGWFAAWRRVAGGTLLFFVVTLGLRVFAEGFWRDPRTSPLVTLDDVVLCLGVFVVTRELRRRAGTLNGIGHG